MGCVAVTFETCVCPTGSRKALFSEYLAEYAAASGKNPPVLLCWDDDDWDSTLDAALAAPVLFRQITEEANEANEAKEAKDAELESDWQSSPFAGLMDCPGTHPSACFVERLSESGDCSIDWLIGWLVD